MEINSCSSVTFLSAMTFQSEGENIHVLTVKNIYGTFNFTEATFASK